MSSWQLSHGWHCGYDESMPHQWAFGHQCAVLAPIMDAEFSLTRRSLRVMRSCLRQLPYHGIPHLACSGSSVRIVQIESVLLGCLRRARNVFFFAMPCKACRRHGHDKSHARAEAMAILLYAAMAGFLRGVSATYDSMYVDNIFPFSSISVELGNTTESRDMRFCIRVGQVWNMAMNTYNGATTMAGDTVNHVTRTVGGTVNNVKATTGRAVGSAKSTAGNTMDGAKACAQPDILDIDEPLGC